MNKLLAYTLTGPGIQTTGGADSINKLESILSAVLGVLTIVGVIFFTIQIILAGFKLISSKGDPKEFQVAQSKLIHNLIGLVIVVVAFGATAFLTNLMGLGNGSIFDLKTNIPTVK